MAIRREIRNSTAEFLIFQIEGKEQGVEVYYKDKTVWCTQKAMGMLFNCSTDNIGLHLKNIFASGELEKEAVTEKISATASDGKKYLTQFHCLTTQAAQAMKRQYYTLRLSSRNTASYKIVCSRATLTSFWVNYLLSNISKYSFIQVFN